MVKKKLLNMFQIFFSELEEKYNELCRINKWCRDYVSDWLVYLIDLLFSENL